MILVLELLLPLVLIQLVNAPVILDTLARLVPPFADVVRLLELLLVPVAIHRGNVAVMLDTLA